MIETIQSLREKSDQLLEGLSDHQERVASKSLQIASLLGLDQIKAQQIYQAALVHDIGKLTWPENLRKGAPASDADWEIIRSHPQRGAAMLAQTDKWKPIAHLVEGHHERFDGEGYPHKIKSSLLPVGVRILTVCDTADAIVSERSYDRAHSITEMISIIKKSSGSHLDPLIVDCYVKLIAQSQARCAHHRF